MCVNNCRKRLAIFLGLIALVAVQSPVGSASDKAGPRNFIPPGKWVLDNGNFVCVANNNAAPNPSRLAAEVAASGSSGNAQVISECKILKYIAGKHSFNANLACTQTYAVSGSIDAYQYKIFGGLSNDKRAYIVKGYVLGKKVEVDRYRYASSKCSLDQKKYIVGPGTKIKQYIDPNLQFLTGLPEGASLSLP